MVQIVGDAGGDEQRAGTIQALASKRIGNMNARRQRSPWRGSRPRDVTCRLGRWPPQEPMPRRRGWWPLRGGDSCPL
jgi:hypothetical protein